MSELYLWAIGALLTLNLAALGVMGRFIKETYDIATDIDVVLHGRTRDQKGFVQRTEDIHRDMSNQHTRVQSHLVVQGRLIDQLTHELARLVNQLDEHEDIDVSIDANRLERLRDLEDEVRRDNDRRDNDRHDFERHRDDD